MNTAWIITRAINQYDQDGEYFVSWFDHKPTFKELKELLPRESVVTLGKLTRGGGRHDYEYEWFYLNEIKQGYLYQ